MEWEQESNAHGWPSFRDDEVGASAAEAPMALAAPVLTNQPAQVVHENIMVMPGSGEAVSKCGARPSSPSAPAAAPAGASQQVTCSPAAGTHLGHMLPDAKGKRYCIDLVCIAGVPAGGKGLEMEPTAQ